MTDSPADPGSQPIRGFAVDTHLLRELGDLLVGRDSTAVLELIKNGYDADATAVTISAFDLGQPDRAAIVVSDNGSGMTLQRFRSAFLRIAGRDKEGAAARSTRYGRAFTGQKGIGRLASQKLGDQLTVRSVPSVGTPGVAAELDWAEIDRQSDLTDLHAGLEVGPFDRFASAAEHGTRLEMRRLKSAWRDSEIAAFVDELRSIQPPPLLAGTTAQALRISSPPLISQLRLRDSDQDDPGFEVRFSGQLETGDDLWARAASEFQWLIELDVRDGRVRYQVSPTTRHLEQEQFAATYRFEAEAEAGLSLQARIYTLARASASRGPLQGMVRRNSGVRFYLEGFRVLPYGEFGDDWLGIDRDYRSGPRYYAIDLDEERSDALPRDDREALSATGNAGYFGAVFATRAGVPDLQSLVNREGFVPGPTLDAVADVLRTGIRLSVRVRRSVYNLARQTAGSRSTPQDPRPQPPGVTREEETAPTPPSESPRSYSTLSPQYIDSTVRERIVAARNVLGAAGRTDGGQMPAIPPSQADEVRLGFEAATTALQQLEVVQPDLRVLASVGLQLGAFVHDINGMLSSVRTIRELVQSLLESSTTTEQRRALTPIRVTADELAHVLARQSSYLTDVLSTDPRRRRSRLSVTERLDGVVNFLQSRLEQAEIGLNIDLAAGLRTPPMFPAEFSVMMTNLLTNAVKNAGHGGRVEVTGHQLPDGGALITISNTGNAVDLTQSERWFLPFESTTTQVDDVLGQGLGLGLPIVRAIAADYNGSAHFVAPGDDYRTAIQVVLEER